MAEIRNRIVLFNLKLSSNTAVRIAKPELPYLEATTAKSMRPTRGPKKRSLFLGVGATGSSDLQKPSTGHTNSGFAVNKPVAAGFRTAAGIFRLVSGTLLDYPFPPPF